MKSHHGETAPGVFLFQREKGLHGRAVNIRKEKTLHSFCSRLADKKVAVDIKFCSVKMNVCVGEDHPDKYRRFEDGNSVETLHCNVSTELPGFLIRLISTLANKKDTLNIKNIYIR